MKLEIPRRFLPESVIPDREVGATGGLNQLFAGLALSGAFVSGGFWLVRRGSSRRVAAIGALVLVGLSGGLIYAALDKPSGKSQLETVKVPANVLVPDKVKVTAVARGDAIRLIVPPAETVKQQAEAKQEAAAERARKKAEEQQARAEAKKKADLAAEEARAAGHLAYARKLIEKNKSEDARTRLRDLLERFPTSKAADDARKLLEQLGK
jgi:hypothetical protein